ncbi:MAG TPA: penicillin-binding protein 2 [Candidatus Limnocylindria bacterium]|nr:penicillin-binding protein 2 [Candidatus Limnocylindria bacterium]
MTAGRPPQAVRRVTGRTVGRNISRVGVTLALAFAALAGGAGYWQVVRSTDLSTSPDDAAVISAVRHVPRGRILDRRGTVLASNKLDANREPYRTYRYPVMSPVIGYASRQFGKAGLELAYDAQLAGLRRADPVADMLTKFQTKRYDPQDITLSISLQLQAAAARGLGRDQGAVVMLDPRTGEVLALASTPTFNASTLTNPKRDEAAASWKALNADKADPLLPRATLGKYVPGSVMKIVTAIAAFRSGSITKDTTFKQQPGAETTGLLVSGYRVRDGHHLFTGDRALDFIEATEVSCNIYFALAGLRTGGAEMDAAARKLGFYAPIPFDLPTASSQLTNGGGPLPGGFLDRVELANAAYGQGETVVTPLQMALVAATVANDGVLMKPHLVRSFKGANGTQTVAPETWTTVLPFNDAAVIKEAMQRAVEGQYGRLFTSGARVPGIPTAGKTGTAQLGGSGEPNSWFIGFAPVDQPRVAIAVVVAHGGGGGARAAPLAGNLMQLFFDTEANR